MNKSKKKHVTFGRAWAWCGAHFKSAGVRRSVIKLAYFVGPVAAERGCKSWELTTYHGEEKTYIRARS